MIRKSVERQRLLALRRRVEETAHYCAETSSDPKDKESHRIWGELRLAEIDAQLRSLAKGGL